MAASSLAVDVRDLKKHYGQTRAVDGVTFSVGSGEVFGLLGPNGAGKTTSIECIEGLRQPDAGEIMVLGLSHRSDRRSIQSRIGVQLQTTGLYPKLSVRELIGLFKTFYARSLPLADLVELVGLADKQHARSKDLSGGQRQRLSLALALVNDPDLVFLDEPTTGLDPQARRALWSVVNDLKSRGKTVVLTTHYMEEAEQLCDRVAVVDHGHIIELDSPAALINKYFRETAIEFIPEVPCDQDALAHLATVTQVVAGEERVLLYSADVPRTMADLFQMVSRDAIKFRDMTVRQATLEDVFLKLTGRRIRA